MEKRVRWLRAVDVKTIFPTDIVRIVSSDPARSSQSATITILSFRKGNESEVDVVAADGQTHTFRLESGHVIDSLQEGLDFLFIPARPSRGSRRALR